MRAYILSTYCVPGHADFSLSLCSRPGRSGGQSPATNVPRPLPLWELPEGEGRGLNLALQCG